jgi:hypothetical protein
MVSVQFGDGNPVVRGIGKQTFISAKGEEAITNPYEFRSQYDPQIQAKVDEIQSLQERLARTASKTVEQVKAEESAKLKQIISDAEKGHFGGGPSAIAILDKRIAELNEQIRLKESPENGKTKQ